MNYKILDQKVEIDDLWALLLWTIPYFKCNDYDLKDAITATAIKSADGEINNLYKSTKTDSPENYQYTKLYSIKEVKELVDYFKMETTRIRIFKQSPKNSTPLHIDKDDKDIIRLWAALNEDDNFKFYFGKEKEEVILKKGQILVFNPNYPHGAANLGNTDRYTLNIVGKPNKWLKEQIYV
jgi:hypothetical protein